jgi:hypothetical protein
MEIVAAAEADSEIVFSQSDFGIVFSQRDFGFLTSFCKVLSCRIKGKIMMTVTVFCKLREINASIPYQFIKSEVGFKLF